MPSQRPSRARIAVVDDDPAVLLVLSGILERAGRACSAYGGGDEAWAALSAAAGLDLLITDVVMPGLDGPALAGRVAERFPACHVLFVSTRRPPPSVEHAGSAGRRAFLAKPFSGEELLRAVRDLLGDD